MPINIWRLQKLDLEIHDGTGLTAQILTTGSFEFATNYSISIGLYRMRQPTLLITERPDERILMYDRNFA